jgi:hypothetical protein
MTSSRAMTKSEGVLTREELLELEVVKNYRTKIVRFLSLKFIGGI